MRRIMDKIYNPKIIYIYILLFPIFEVITSLMVRNNMPFTFGMIYKSIFIIYAAVYILFFSKSNKKINYIYMGILLATIIMCIATVSDFKIENVNSKLFKSVIKFVNLPIMLTFFYTYFKDREEFNKNVFEYSILIYCVSIIIAVITRTSEPTYLLSDNTIKLGFKGWFFAGNEIGNLLGIMYPFAIYLASTKGKALYYVMLVIVTFCTVEAGTKTATLSLAITIVICLIFSVVMSFVIKDETIVRSRIITIVLFVLLAIYAPFSTSYKIFKIRMDDAQKIDVKELIMQDVADQEESSNENAQNVTENTEKTDKETNVIENVIYSGRQEFKKYQRERFDESKMINKLFGLKNNGINNIEGVGSFEIVERDFHDILYMYGIVGCVTFFAPVIYVLSIIVINIIKKINKLDLKIVTSGISIALAFSIAYIAGHVLLTPPIVMFLSANMAGMAVYAQKSEEKG